MNTAKISAAEPIAIIGMSGRFPGANNCDELWDAIVEKRDCLTDYPGGRSPELDAFYAQAGASNRPPSRRGGFLPGMDRFDAGFFQISPREAEWTDPQQRLLLELAWEAWEDAGQTREALAGSKAGVFIGMWTTDYDVHANANSPVADFFHLVGGPLFGASGRIAFQFDLRGPDVTLNAACASSLVAVHLACRSLRSGESSVALAGGVNLIFRHEDTQALAGAGMLSKDGCCKFGDADADGFVRSEGGGLLVLKRLANAERDGDHILALIRGTSAVNGGRVAGSMSTPSREGERQAMLEALEDGHVDPASIGYVEAHGTGTSVGDPVEVAAIGSVFGVQSGRSSPCRVGSVKSNIGHAESGAGAAAIIKAVYAVRNGILPPTIHVRRPNPAIDWETLGVSLQLESEAWDVVPGNPRRASVNGLGLAGTNAHIVVEEWPSSLRKENSKRASYLLPFSAASMDALKQRAADLAVEIKKLERAEAEAGERGLGDLCYTSALRRTHLPYRLAVTGANLQEIGAGLQSFADGEASPSVASGIAADGAAVAKAAFIFPGQGSQWIGMGRELLKTEPAFRLALERCDEEIRKETGWSILDQLQDPAREERLTRIDVIQPTLFAIEVALAELWKSWGIIPSAVVGHSMGEVAAARIAGILSLADAVKIICRRSALLMRVAGLGAMVVVDLPRPEAERAILGLEDRISVAVSNSPRSTVLAGDPAALDGIVERLEREEVFCRWVRVDVASHSPQMDPLKDDLLKALGEIKPQAGEIPLYSTVEACRIDGPRMDTGYWVRNLRETVQFAAAIELLLAEGCEAFIEMSPHPILVPFVEQTSDQTGAQQGKRALAVGSLRREEPETTSLLVALGKLYVRGCAIDWGKIYPAGNQVKLPAYPWQRERFWIESSIPRTAFTESLGHPLLGEPLKTGSGDWIWSRRLSLEAQPWLKDHGVQGSVVLPASAFAEIGRAALQQIVTDPAGAAALGSRTPSVLVEGLRVQNAIALTGESTELQVIAASQQDGTFLVRFFSRPGGSAEWGQAAEAQISAGAGNQESVSLVAWEEAEFSPETVSGRSHAEMMAKLGYEYGPNFQQVEWLCLQGGRQGDGALASIRVPDSFRGDGQTLHPATLDAGLQVLAHCILANLEQRTTLLPVEFERLEFHAISPAALSPAGDRVYARASLTPNAECKGDVEIFDGAGALLVGIHGLAFKPLAAEPTEKLDRMLYEMAWEELPKAPSQEEQVAGPGAWLLVGDASEPASRLAQALAQRGEATLACRIVDAKDTLLAHAQGLRGIVVLTPLALDGASLLWQAEAALADAAGLVRELADMRENPVGRGSHADARLWFVTQAVYSLGNARPDAWAGNALGAGFWGLSASIENEHPEFRSSCIDLGKDADDPAFATLASELIADPVESRILLRDGARYAARLKPWRESGSTTARASESASFSTSPTDRPAVVLKPFALSQAVRGSLDDFELRTMDYPAPGAGEIEIEIEAAGLNFLDVLRAMALNEALSGSRFGGECAGTVLRAGAGTGRFSPGDRVMAISPSFEKEGLLATRITMPADLAVAIPQGLTISEAAGVPCAFLTAYYALVRLARLQKGEKVLIHAASGGVGLAAVQVAQWLGAEIYATAGSPEKRAFLKEIGIQHVMDSRSLDFRQTVLELTQGAGVDVVLNSLAGPAIGAGLKTLAPYGRFVEIGKRDIWENSKIGLEPFKRNLSLFAVDLAKSVEDRRSMVGVMLEEVADLFKRAIFRALPTRNFPISQAGSAFRHMAEAKHIGKVVLSMRDRDARVTVDPNRLSGDSTYLITGGLGALGLEAARTLAERGARHIILVSRGSAGQRAKEALAALTAQNVRITVRSADVSQPSEVDELFREIAATHPPLRGIIHAAGILDDAVVRNLSTEKFHSVMAGKVGGALAIDRHLAPGGLDFLVYYASVSGVLGIPGQGNYAAANAMLDALALAQRARGIPATSIDWGTWAEGGLAAGADRGERLATQGLLPLRPEQAKQLLLLILEKAPARIVAMDFDAAAWSAAYPASRPGLLAELSGSASTAPAGGLDFLDGLRRLPAAEIRGAIETWLREQVAAVLRCKAERVLPDKPLRSLGLDSLMALEFRNRLERGFRLKLPATLAWNYPTVVALAAHLETKAAVHAPDEPRPTAPQEPKRSIPSEPKPSAQFGPQRTAPTPAGSGPDISLQEAEDSERSAAELLEAELLGAQILLRE